MWLKIRVHYACAIGRVLWWSPDRICTATAFLLSLSLSVASARLRESTVGRAAFAYLTIVELCI